MAVRLLAKLRSAGRGKPELTEYSSPESSTRKGATAPTREFRRVPRPNDLVLPKAGACFSQWSKN